PLDENSDMSQKIMISQDPEEKHFLGLKSDPFIFLVSVGIIVTFVVATVILGDTAREGFSAVAGWLLENLGWMYVGGVSLILVFLIGIFASRYGRVKLGDDDDEPEHRLVVWFSMLFAGGVGAVLMFWG